MPNTAAIYSDATGKTARAKEQAAEEGTNQPKQDDVISAEDKIAWLENPVTKHLFATIQQNVLMLNNANIALAITSPDSQQNKDKILLNLTRIETLSKIIASYGR